MQGHYFVSEWPEGNAYGVTLQVAENLNSDRGRVKTQPGQTQRENTALPRNARGALPRRGETSDLQRPASRAF